MPNFRDDRDIFKRNKPLMNTYQGQRQNFSGVGPRGYQRSDQRIMEDVCERLTQHGQIDATDITVDVKEGEVTLAGSVDTRATRRMAEDVVDGVPGVKDVHNQLRVQRQGQRAAPPAFRPNRVMNQSGMPGGGKGRVDRVGRSGVYPASGPWPEQDAPVQGQMSWGQGERGEMGYYDSGRSSLDASFERRQRSRRNRSNPPSR